MHTDTMHKSDGKCEPISAKPRHRITVALDEGLWNRFRPILKNKWVGSFTSWLEYAMECYSRATCEGCPYEPDDDDREKAPDGIGKVLDKES